MKINSKWDTESLLGEGRKIDSRSKLLKAVSKIRFSLLLNLSKKIEQYLKPLQMEMSLHARGR